MSSRIFIGGAAMLVLWTSSVPVVAQRSTLAERVAASDGKPMTLLVIRDDPPTPISELTERSDLVLQATLSRLRSCIGDNTAVLVTDYEIKPKRVLHVRGTTGAATPGPGRPWVWRLELYLR